MDQCPVQHASREPDYSVILPSCTELKTVILIRRSMSCVLRRRLLACEPSLYTTAPSLRFLDNYMI